MCGCVANPSSWRLNICYWLNMSVLYQVILMNICIVVVVSFNTVECGCDFSHVHWWDQPLFLIDNILESKREEEKKSLALSGKDHRENIFSFYISNRCKQGNGMMQVPFENILDSRSLDEDTCISHAWSESLLPGLVSLNWFVSLSILHLHMAFPVVWHDPLRRACLK